MNVKIEPTLSFSLEEHELTLWRNYDHHEGEVVSAAEDSYRLEFTAEYDGCFDRLQFHEAMFRVLNIIAGAGESISENSGEVQLTKAQYFSLATIQSQPDANMLTKILDNAHQEDINSMRNQLKLQNIKR